MNCKQCGKLVEGKYSKNKYCSQACRGAHWRAEHPDYQSRRWSETYTPKEKTRLVCERCGGEFFSFLLSAKYCSTACKAHVKYQREKKQGKIAPYRRRERSCAICGKNINGSNRLYCSGACKEIGKLNRAEPKAMPMKDCVICGNPFFTAKANRKYCSLRCERQYEYDGRRDRESYKEKNRMQARRREAAAKNLPHDLTAAEWKEAVKAFDGRCAYCGQPADKLEKEHFVPFSLGGGFTKTNIIPACKSCNSKKSNKNPVDWLVGLPNALVAYARIVLYLGTHT